MTEVAHMQLEQVLQRIGPLAIAVSGGVDSMTLAHVAAGVGDALIIHATSPAVPAEATARVRLHAATAGWALIVTEAGEFADERYVANPVNRCYFCKTNLYQRISGLTDRVIASGANLDDLGDYRPGLLAARERRVVHPLIEAGIDKRTVRALAARMGLADLAELPAQPCLSSRIETAIPIRPEDLAFVHRIETAMRETDPDISDVRCRITRAGVVVEVDEPDVALLARLAPVAADQIEAEGRLFAGIAPYRRGSAFLTAKLSAAASAQDA